MNPISYGGFLDVVRTKAPLVHSITNYVTVNDCANALLACGASPIMSDEPAEVGDITSICGGLTLNIGTLHKASIEAMFVAGKRSAELGHPLILDPVGAGASTLRTEVAGQLLDELPITVVRANMSEAKALVSGAARTRGVDVCPDDIVTTENLSASVAFARDFARKIDAIVAITGAIDIVADANHAFAVRNGTSLQGKITGAGCMLSCLCSAFVVANPHASFEATLAAVVFMGVAGQVAAARMGEFDGNGMFRAYLLDALYLMDGRTLEAEALVEECA